MQTGHLPVARQEAQENAPSQGSLQARLAILTSLFGQRTQVSQTVPDAKGQAKPTQPPPAGLNRLDASLTTTRRRPWNDGTVAAATAVSIGRKRPVQSGASSNRGSDEAAAHRAHALCSYSCGDRRETSLPTPTARNVGTTRAIIT